MTSDCIQVLLIALLVSSVITFPEEGFYKKLHRDLFKDYDKKVIPLIHHRKSMNVTLKISPIHMRNVDIKEGTVTLDAWIELGWHDDFLKWDNSHYGGISVLQIPSSEVYIPDITLYNSFDYASSESNIYKTKVLVYSNGNIMWVPPVTLKSLCNIDATKWPFDEHVCTLKFGSWTYDGHIVNLWPNGNAFDLSDYIKSSEWDLSFINSSREEKYYPCCTEPYPSITVNLRLKHKQSLYCYVVFAPAVAALILGLISFWYPLRSTARIALNISSLLILVLLLLSLGIKLGFGLQGIPFAVRYLMRAVALIIISLIWTTIGSNLSLIRMKLPFANKVLTPLTNYLEQKIEHESIRLTNSDNSHDKHSPPQTQPNMQMIILAIDKIIFIIVFLTTFLIHL